jgi:hypothetical protein
MIKSLSGFDCFTLEIMGVEGIYKKKSLLVNDQNLHTMIEYMLLTLPASLISSIAQSIRKPTEGILK